jgi:fructose-1-phosphate kinase PfkB-like protein
MPIGGKSMIVFGANLTTDRTLLLRRLEPGTVIRPRSAAVTAGGKSVNVCRAARAFAVRPRLVANLPGRAGEMAGDLLEEEGHDVVRVRTGGELRTATILIEDDRRITVLNEPGPSLTAAGRQELLEALDAECARAATSGPRVAGPDRARHRVLAASGSLPPGQGDLYADVVRLGQAHGLLVVLDAARADLAAALAAGPDVVTPNLAEALAVLSGGPISEAVEPDLPDLHATALDAASALVEAGARAALVTVGRHGVAAAGAGGRYWVDAPAVDEVSAIGAGDAFVGGLACALEADDGLPAATLQAVAAGSASVTTDLAGSVDAGTLARLLADPGLVARGVTR